MLHRQDADLLASSWNQTLATSLDGAALLASPIPMQFIDSEPFLNSVQICDGTVTVLEQYIHEGGFRFGCSNGSFVNFGLKNVVASVRRGSTAGPARHARPIRRAVRDLARVLGADGGDLGIARRGRETARRVAASAARLRRGRRERRR